MTSNLRHHKNYTELGITYQLVLPLSLENVVSEDDSVRLLSQELEELSKETVFIDGTKLEACANKYIFVLE